jgi:DNA-binding CsgD family transcriptional regulator
LLAEGRAPGELAGYLSVSEAEVDAHLTRLFARMGATTRTEAVAAALRRGLLSSNL